jgi:hypothetical protein
MPRLSADGLEGLRSCLRPEYGDLPREHLEQVLASSVSDMAPTIAEDFMKSLSSLGKAVVPTLERAAPSIIQGAVGGASAGGPLGALIGAGTGLASSALGGSKTAPAAPTAPAPAAAVPPGAVLSPVAPQPAQASPAATSAPAAVPAPSLPTGQSAAATVFGLLKNPTVQQALMSQVLGASGTPQVATAAGTSLPRAAVNSLLMQLLANASEGLPEQESALDEGYLQDARGQYLVDPASFDQRAAFVLSRLQSESFPSLPADPGELFSPVEWMPDEFEEGWPAGARESSESVRFY